MLLALERCWFAADRKRDSHAYVGFPRLDALKGLEKRLRTLADEIERVNDSVYGQPGHAFETALRSAHSIVNDERRETAAQEAFEDFRRRIKLPDELERYAEYLATLRGRKRDVCLDQEMDLLDLIELATAKPHLREGADLLTAIYAVANYPRGASETILADRRNRYRKSGKVPVKLNDTETALAVVRAFGGVPNSYSAAVNAHFETLKRTLRAPNRDQRKPG
jgi:hypothetical protein